MRRIQPAEGMVITGSKLGPTLLQNTIMMRMVRCHCGKVFWRPDATIAVVESLHCGCMLKAKQRGSVMDVPTEALGSHSAAE